MTYNKTNWQNGDIITADKLNNLENGVSNNDANITSAVENAATKAELSQVSNELADLTTTVNNNTTTLNTKTNAVQAAQASMPSNKYIDLTLGASGATYTAPANGFITLCKTANGNQYVTLRNSINGLFIFSSGISGNWVACTIPCKKSESINVEYTTGGTTNIFRFIYAQGESEV